MDEKAISYDAEHIQVMDAREVVRKRPGMYVGSTSERGVREMVFGVVGRAVNAILEVPGCVGCVDVTLMSDGGVRVADNGPGVGVGEFEALLTRVYRGAGPGGRGEVMVGSWGMGMYVPNVLSAAMTAEVRNEEGCWVQEFARGVAVGSLTRRAAAAGSGMTFMFRPDGEIFESVACSFEALDERFRELAFLNRGVEISLRDDRESAGESRFVRYRFPGGVRDFVCVVGVGSPSEVIGFEQEDPRMGGTVDVAMVWHGTGPGRVLSFANSRPTRDGGTHEEGLRDGIASALEACARERRLPVAGGDLRVDGRVGVGLTAVVSVKVDEPEFLGSVHSVLGGAAIRDGVARAVREHLGRWLNEHPEQAREIIDRIAR